MTHYLTQEQDVAIQKIFNAVDRDRSGYVGASELTMLVKHWGNKISESEIQDMISEIDVGPNGGDGKIDLNEFRNFFTRSFSFDDTVGKDAELQREIEECFDMFDTGTNGEISAAGLHKMMAGMGESITVEEAGLIVEEVSNGKQGIALENFVNVMTP